VRDRQPEWREARDMQPGAIGAQRGSVMRVGAERRVLLQFPISHYCEKARWHLDLKQLPYRLRNVLPGPHLLINRSMSVGRTVPVLIDAGRAIGDSTAIAMHLEERYPNSPLLVRDATTRARVLELEAHWDGTLGPAVRKWAYGHALAIPGMIRTLFFRGYGAAGRAAGVFLSPILEREIRRMYAIDDAGIEHASQQIDASIEGLEQLIDGDPNRYLVGDCLTLADVTAAALLAPLVAPPATPWADFPAEPQVFQPRRAALRARPAGRWVLARYARDRPAPTHRA
jgi:glutathione S-transferase